MSDVNLRIHQGETFALVGESGGGKSILTLSVMQLLPSTAKILGSSQVMLGYQDLFFLSEKAMRKIRGKRIAMVFQEPMTSINPVLTIGDQIGEVLRYHLKLSGKIKQERVIELLNSVGMSDPKHCSRQSKEAYTKKLFDPLPTFSKRGSRLGGQ